MGVWHNSGLWDLRASADGRLERVLCREYAEALLRSQRVLAEVGCA
jgi:hypothetical protein